MGLLLDLRTATRLLTCFSLLNQQAGDVGFDPLGISELIDVRWLREAELKHGRVCMLAATGMIVQDVAKFPGVESTFGMLAQFPKAILRVARNVANYKVLRSTNPGAAAPDVVFRGKEGGAGAALHRDAKGRGDEVAPELGLSTQSPEHWR